MAFATRGNGEARTAPRPVGTPAPEREPRERQGRVRVNTFNQKWWRNGARPPRGHQQEIAHAE
eukprot:7456644-Lingulodinium_polyedra.AAC.1